MKIKAYHPGPWESAHAHANAPDFYEWPTKHPVCLWFHKPIPWGGKMVDMLSGVAVMRSSRKWIAIRIADERIWLRKREVRCIRFDHPPKRPGHGIFEEVLANASLKPVRNRKPK